MDTWSKYDYFPSSVYILDKPEFLDLVKQVSQEYVEDYRKNLKVDELYPMIQTRPFANDKRLNEFVNYIAQTGWNILSEQGFAMDNKQTTVTEMWTHSYLKYGSMEQHVHPVGSYITGFYVIETPKKCSEIVLFDPRPGKVQCSIGVKFEGSLKEGHDRVYFTPKPGMMFFSNSWLPHGFTRNGSDSPFSFVHFNIGLKDYYPPPPPAEVI